MTHHTLQIVIVCVSSIALVLKVFILVGVWCKPKAVVANEDEVGDDGYVRVSLRRAMSLWAHSKVSKSETPSLFIRL